MHTITGFIVSSFLLILFFMFALIKFQALTIVRNPNISVATISDHFDSNERVKYDDLSGFKIAFGIVDYLTREDRSSSDYVKFMATFETRSQDSWYNKVLPFEKCTE